ncbi:MAG: DEAD/DEAH box helicase, partial [Bacteroidaceae bacterium]|nr:DEAD/DEAH box helicase [Bacteroidaceae bacterium]
MKTFEELGLSEELLKAIAELGYEQPMPVQEEVIPYLLGEDNDVVALAQTGTGKTAAYGLPLLQKTDVENVVPQALILCPTRELCLQIASDLTDYSKYIEGLKIIPVYGGSSIESQIRSLHRGVHIVVATPGRLLDLMRREVVQLGAVNNVVLDEADEMLSMGFSEDLTSILAEVPENRNTLLFSATMSAEISRISKNYLHDAKEIVIGTKNEGAKNVSHVAYLVQAKDKYLALKRIVDFYPKIYGIVFCRTRMETAEIADKLIQDGYSADALHGDLSQQQRDLTMQKFRQHRTQLLVATDVAARGLDVDDLTHVINYGFPDDIEVYTHRSGRTGRADKKGISVAIIHVREKSKLRAIEAVIKKKFEMGTIPTGEEICEKQLYKTIDEIERADVNEEEIEKFLPAVYRKLEWLSKEDLIKRVLSREFNRFADYYANAPEIEQPQENRGGKGEGGRKSRKREKGSRTAESGYTRLFINLGRMDGIVPAKLIDLLNHNIHKRIEVGRIDLMTKFSFFEVHEEDTQTVLKGLEKAKFNGRPVGVEVADANEKPGSAEQHDNQPAPLQAKEHHPRKEENSEAPRREYKRERREEKPAYRQHKKEEAPKGRRGRGEAKAD